jgi:hypothetical protein
MVDPIEANRRNWDERATIHARDTTGDYMLDRFRRVRTLSMPSKPPNSATFPESASSICNAISGATRSASCGAARWRPGSIFRA